jgi:DNA processing protein
MDDAVIYWIGFNRVKGIGSVRLKNLMDYFSSLEIAWNAPAEGLRAAGLSQKLVENLIKIRQKDDLQQVWEDIQRKNISVLTWDSPEYPRRLRELDQSPPVLYLRGTLKNEDELSVAIVGTRRASSYGRQATEELAACLAHNGVTVISGLARGVDTFAHQTALKAGGRSLAVLGCGVDVIYPPENRKLAEQLIGQGALISDYPPGTQPEGTNFPPRNRIISGLSMATVVVEAGETSGALITATFAAEQGREVFALPGSIYAPLSKGTNRLIQQGATPLLKIEEVLEVLGMERAHEHREARQSLPSDPIEAQILTAIQAETIHIDELTTLTGLPIGQVSATLAIMELKGMVRQVGGMNFVAIRESHQDYSWRDIND